MEVPDRLLSSCRELAPRPSCPGHREILGRARHVANEAISPASLKGFDHERLRGAADHGPRRRASR